MCCNEKRTQPPNFSAHVQHSLLRTTASPRCAPQSVPLATELLRNRHPLVPTAQKRAPRNLALATLSRTGPLLQLHETKSFLNLLSRPSISSHATSRTEGKHSLLTASVRTGPVSERPLPRSPRLLVLPLTSQHSVPRTSPSQQTPSPLAALPAQREG